MSSLSHYGNGHNLLLLKMSQNKCPVCVFIMEILMCHKAACKDPYLSIFIIIHFTEKHHILGLPCCLVHGHT